MAANCAQTCGICEVNTLQNGTCVSCSDGIMNGAETDVDCGGPVCGRCTRGSQCSVDQDCGSDQCEVTSAGKICTSCFNGLRDGAETGVDCGGAVCAQKCEVGGACRSDSDCMTGKCGTDISSEQKCAQWGALCTYTAANGTSPEACEATLVSSALPCSSVDLNYSTSTDQQAACLGAGACVYSSAGGGTCLDDPLVANLLQSHQTVNRAKSCCRVGASRSLLQWNTR